LSIEEDKIEPFKKAINEIGDRFLTPEDLIPEINIDAHINFDEITLAQVKKIQIMEPFGAENPAPVFLSRKVTLRDVQYIGKDGSHVRFKAHQGSARREGIAFNFRDAFQYLDTKDNLMDLVYEVEINRWNGNEKVQLKLLDMVPSSQDDENDL
ncbi:MAG: single-stranded-DNA-specific exonuclease RecJ, partial [Nitrospinales bacterium]